MKRTVKRKQRMHIIFLPVLICGILTAVYAMLFVMTDDTKSPQIQIDQEILEVSVGADEAALLQGVSAKDNADGDVTDSLIVEKISSLAKDHTATVTYAAFDRSGNVAKASRTLKYMDYQSPKFSQNQSLTFSANSMQNILSFMGATDAIDGDISSRVKGTLLSNANSLNEPGLYQVEFRVTNSMNETVYLTLPVEVYPAGTYNANVELSDYLVYVKTGTAFDPESYLEKVVVGTREYSLKNQDPTRQEKIRVYFNRYVDPDSVSEPNVRVVNVDMLSDVDTKTPGVYSVAYTVDCDGLYTGYARLNVVVEE